MEKTDAILGEQVHQHLLKVGLETPMIYDNVKVRDEKKIKTIAKHMTSIMEELGLDLTDDSLIDTPNRVAKMYVREIFNGLNYDNFPKCTRIENKMGENRINIASNYSSMCYYKDPENDHLRLSMANFNGDYSLKDFHEEVTKTNVINSCETDIEILKSTISILGLVATSNQIVIIPNRR